MVTINNWTYNEVNANSNFKRACLFSSTSLVTIQVSHRYQPSEWAKLGRALEPLASQECSLAGCIHFHCVLSSTQQRYITLVVLGTTRNSSVKVEPKFSSYPTLACCWSSLLRLLSSAGPPALTSIIQCTLTAILAKRNAQNRSESEFSMATHSCFALSTTCTLMPTFTAIENLP